MLDSSNDGGTLLLGDSFSDEVDPADYTSVAISPNGTVRRNLLEPPCFSLGTVLLYLRIPLSEKARGGGKCREK